MSSRRKARSEFVVDLTSSAEFAGAERRLDNPPALDPDFVARCKESLADPRPSILADEVRAELRARYAAHLKRGK